MKTFLIDYQRPDGTKDFKAVQAETPERAVEILRAAGIDGWTGCRFSDYTVTGVTERT